MAKMRFIGDVHGKFRSYKKIIKECEASRQVGDMGIGFFRNFQNLDENRQTSNPPHRVMVEGDHKFIRGNHDNPRVCKNHSQFIQDGTVEGDIMYVGGALSIDIAHRTESLNWWKDEELSLIELNDMVTKYLEAKPRIMVTHDCPESVTGNLMNDYKLSIPSRTRQAFDSMFSLHKPEIWIHGHWHVSRDQNILGTRFICLAELEYIDLEV